MRNAILSFGLAAFIATAFPAGAVASHPRVKSAASMGVAVVPEFEQCLEGSSATHGAPLAVPSCSPPVPSSSYLTLVAPDRPSPYNQPVDGHGLMAMKVACLTPGTTQENGDPVPCIPTQGDQIDVKVTFAFGGVRCVGAAGQGSCTGGAASLYSGKLMAQWRTRLTDHLNSTPENDCSGGIGARCPATSMDVPLSIGMQCSAGSCNYVTSLDVSTPGLIRETYRGVFDMGRIEIVDGGLDGELAGGPAPGTGVCPPSCAASGDGEAVAFVQGLYVH
jgi:hypothetical protein